MSEPAGLYDRPVLVLDPGMHTGAIRRVDVDREGRFAVTASEDKTVRLWSLADGRLERTIRLAAGPGLVGTAYAVAISPDGTTVAAGGWTRISELDPQEQVYMFDRGTGAMIGRIGGLPNIVNDLAFSPDGSRLAAVLNDGRGLRLFARDPSGRWPEVAADGAYGDRSDGVAFIADSRRLATTSCDGRVRLYDGGGRLLRSVETPHALHALLAFNPVDGRLAVGSHESAEVLLYEGNTLAPCRRPTSAASSTAVCLPLPGRPTVPRCLQRAGTAPAAPIP